MSKRDPVLEKLEEMYLVLEALEDFSGKSFPAVRATIRQTSAEWYGGSVDYQAILQHERKKRHNRFKKEQLHERPKLTLVHSAPDLPSPSCSASRK